MNTTANMNYVKKISKKLIKPHTPTPENLKNYKISFLDQLREPAINFGVVLFYESKPKKKASLQCLEESLAQILVQFYPLAGRYIKKDWCVACGDQGVEFTQAEASNDVVLADFLDKHLHLIDDLLPDQYSRVDEAPDDPLVSIQATHFRCGGLALTISVSHRVLDASSLGTFLAAWSNATNPDCSYETITPSFDLPSLLPNKVDHVSKKRTGTVGDAVVVKRISFSEEALTRLRSKLRPNRPISAVRVVCAVVAKALIRLDRVKHGRSRDFLIAQPINMRGRTIPPQPKHSCGNFVMPSVTRTLAADEAREAGIQELVDAIGDAVRKSIADYAELVSPNRDGRDIVIKSFANLAEQLANPDVNATFFTDWSKAGFYDPDFGFGKPVWASTAPLKQLACTTTVLMTNREGDGIEACLHFNQSDMPYFDQDEEIRSLLKFT